jgi:hypothetical protein
MSAPASIFQPVQSTTQLTGSVTKKSVVAAVSAVLVFSGTGTSYAVGRYDTWQHHLGFRVPFMPSGTNMSVETVARPDVRSTAQHIDNIRTVLNPSVSELASLFEVSRQSIYKWLSGATPEPDKSTRIIELSRIADTFRNARVSRAGALLKMKSFDGLSLLDIWKSHANSEDHVVALIAEARIMENSYKNSGLSASKSKSTSDWQSYISIPGSIEQD